ncbi:prenylated flavin chaperone LpdD [Levilactobacillus suantsaii]|uniref:Amino acid decarboxylase n=1 Tax=Levilactobacillus suantsaii TaxID=2292255 RepID=A0A4Q0VIG4_9LACO|nr:amino acid decarboxylase [Levilactobacillus suantsaii]QMU09052.1 amino acid decarboxylase [Levilactobacillus suantsaii]RXI78286.1 amino acid decarboxylase [Levilactobacillus suantsaii]
MPRFQVTQTGYTIQDDLQVVGRDLLIVVTGGTTPHIGDVTTLTATTPLQTVKFPSHDGRFHKDNFVSERIARVIQPVLEGTCTITAGIHVDQITQAQIAASAPMGDELGRQIAAWLKDHPATAPKPQYYRDDQTPPRN